MAATTTDRRKPSPFGLLAGSLAAFFALLAFLAVQVRAGGDPALGPPKPAASAEPRRVIVHRVIVRRIVVTDRAPAQRGAGVGVGGAAASAGGTAAASGRNGGGGAAAAGGTSSAPAPAPATPAPSAPAPAAPVTTGSS